MSELISGQKLIEELEEELVAPSNPENPELRTKYWNAGIGRAINIVQSQPPADQWVPLSEVYRVIAGHSDYHGDNILAALTCIAVGKEVKPVRPLPADVPNTNVVEWIPCSERLPLLCEPVLVTDALKCVFKAFLLADGNWETEHFILEGNYITAWMPLPEPYKGVE